MNAYRRIHLGKYIRRALLWADWLTVNALLGLALHITNVTIPPQWMLWLIANISFVPVVMYEARRDSTWLRAIQLDKTLQHSLATVGIHSLFMMSLTELSGQPSPGLHFYLTYYFMLTVVLTAWAIISSRLLKHYRRLGYNYLRVAIVGANSTAARLYEAMKVDHGFGYKVLGFFDNDHQGSFCDCYCAPLSNLENFVRDNKIDQIFFALPTNGDELSQAVKVADDAIIDFYYVPQISRYVPRGFQISSIGSVPLLTMRANPLNKPINQLLKRTFDIVFSAVALVFYPLVYIPVAIMIKATSPGPVYFVQERTGLRGKTFKCIKFRTMHVNADADRRQATHNDPRKTRVGEFLRRTNIDELPQFINVLMGDMSVVGPRPHMLKHTEQYSQIVKQYMVRHAIKPGITGWAQVNGYRGITDQVWKMEKRVEHDVWYIEHWTLMLDFKIICRTVYNSLRRDDNAF